LREAFELAKTEQEEIVRRVRGLFALADKLETRYTKGKVYADKLTQGVVVKVFAGELGSH
jgi:type I restriction enzyme S subunit